MPRPELESAKHPTAGNTQHKTEHDNMKQTVLRILTLASLGLAVALIVFPALGQSTNNPAKVEIAREKGDEQMINQLVSDWGAAYDKRDPATLDRVLADDYIATDANGKVYAKENEMALVKAGQFVVSSSERLASPKLRVYGDAAVKNFHARLNAKLKGEDYSGEVRTTVIFVKIDGRWQVVSWQQTWVKGSR